MNCLDARRALGAEPARRTAELAAHLAECAACAKVAADLARLDVLLRRALEVPVPPAGTRPAAARARAARPRWFALAASLAGAAVLSALVWSLYPREALAGAVVGHMAHEPQAWQRTAVAVPPGALDYVLGRSGVALAPGALQVSYAQSCWFRGHFVPHLVVQTPDGPITVMVLPQERVGAATLVDEGGYRVLLVPAPRGAIAVLSQGPVPAASLELVVARVTAAVRFIG